MKVKNLNFGEAIEALKQNKKVSREGWNGKDMFLVKAGDYGLPVKEVRPNGVINKEFLEDQGCTEFKIMPHIDMWAANKTYVVGWLASQTDMFAEDWYILD